VVLSPVFTVRLFLSLLLPPLSAAYYISLVYSPLLLLGALSLLRLSMPFSFSTSFADLPL
jgi:hypothetical protein